MKLLPYEIWRDIPGCPGYQVSNNNGFRGPTRKTNAKWVLGKRKKRAVGINGKTIEYHILVAKAFPEVCGEWFDDCNVHHSNFNPYDNRPENLVVLTATEHSKLHYQETIPDTFKKPTHKRIEGIKKALTGRRATEKHKPILQLTPNGELVKEWDCISDVTKNGYSPGNVCYCCKGHLRTAYGYMWRYK